MKKRCYKIIVLLITMIALTGCSLLSRDEGKEQKELISNFLQSFYSYEYTEGNADCLEENNDLCEEIIDNVSLFLSSDTRVDNQVANSLIVWPANYSKVSVDYISHSIDKKEIFETENGEIYGFHISPNVKIKSSITQKEVIKVPTSFLICLVKENDRWKVEGIDFMADKYLFYVDSLFY